MPGKNIYFPRLLGPNTGQRSPPCFCQETGVQDARGIVARTPFLLEEGVWGRASMIGMS